jgi:Uma2 family endonuclease
MASDRVQPTELEGIGQLGAPRPVYFPTGATVPETKRHLELRTLLYQVLKLAFADRAAIGCDQFVYWDPTEPRACLAPDAFVRLGEADHLFRSWKVWERGAPQVAVEVISEADERDRDWEAKLEKYQRLGVSELVRFDPDLSERPLRIWDSIEGGLMERELAEPRAQSRCLPGFWIALEQPETGLTLRLSHDERGAELYPTPAEREAEAHRGRRAAEERVREEAEGRRAAERRICELEEELRRRP